MMLLYNLLFCLRKIRARSTTSRKPLKFMILSSLSGTWNYKKIISDGACSNISATLRKLCYNMLFITDCPKYNCITVNALAINIFLHRIKPYISAGTGHSTIMFLLLHFVKNLYFLNAYCTSSLIYPSFNTFSMAKPHYKLHTVISSNRVIWERIYFHPKLFFSVYPGCQI